MCSLMKIKHLILLTTTAVAASSLYSCKEEPYMITAEEEYTRNFIKEFGLIDPNQDWNLAEGSTVTVKAGNTPAEVKAYMKVDNTYYLVANLKDVAGDVKIPFDMPEGTTDIMVKINGTRYYTSPGGTVDPSNVASRVLNTAGGPGVTIELLPDERVGGGVNYLKIPSSNILNFTEILEENDRNLSIPDLTNLVKNKKQITENFVARASSFWIFPEYWRTGSFDSNTIGIYYHAKEGDDRAEKIFDIDGNGYWIVKVPIYQPDGTNSIVDNLFALSPAQATLTNWDNYSTNLPIIFNELKQQFDNQKLPTGWDVAISDGTDKYKSDEWSILGAGKSVVRTSVDGYYTEFSKFGISELMEEGEDTRNIIVNAANSAFPEYNNSINAVRGDYWELIVDYYTETLINVEDMGYILEDNTKYPFFKSKGIKITFDKTRTFGFYIENGKTKYSEAKFNETLYLNSHPYTQACYVCTFIQGTDSYGNTLRRLCFEDWFSDAVLDENGIPGTCEFGLNTNFDMNDMVFRVYGFDEIATHQDVEVGTIEDPDNPTTPEVDETYQWLLAVEDLGTTDDFDFNDIIIGISSKLVNEVPEGARIVGSTTATEYKKVTYKALAAGGTRPAYVFYGDDLLYPDGKEGRAEWHAWFGDGTHSTTTMINTNAGPNATGATCTIYYETFTLDTTTSDTTTSDTTTSGSYDVVNKGLDFKIGIDTQTNTNSSEISTDYFEEKTNEAGKPYFVKPANAGEAPQMFLIPDTWEGSGKWQWPIERSHISSCYSGFQQWVQDKESEAATSWYKNAKGNVCRPSK